MAKSIIFKIALMVLSVSLPHLRKIAESSDNPWDDVGIEILDTLVKLFKSGEIEISK